MRFLLTLLLFVLPTVVAADIRHADESGLDLYVRIHIDESTFIAVEMPEGVGGAQGTYRTSDADLVLAGLVTKNLSPGYYYTVRVGATPSTSNNDAIYGDGRIAWSGSVEVVQPVNVQAINGYTTVDGYTWAQTISVIAANAAGEITGSETNDPVLMSLDGMVDRITAEVDLDGNRTITIDVSDLP